MRARKWRRVCERVCHVWVRDLRVGESEREDVRVRERDGEFVRECVKERDAVCVCERDGGYVSVGFRV